MKIYGLIPAYNEEKTIREVVKRIKKLGFKPLVIDDSSSDKTGEIARKAGAIVLRHEKNKGKGRAIRTGFNFLKDRNFDYLVLIDADMQYSPEEALKVLAPLQAGEADFVTGCRKWKEIPLRHRLGNLGWRGTFNFLFGTRFKDTNCGLMALTRNAMKKVWKVHGGYIIESVLFIQALKKGLRIKQVPVNVTYKKKSDVLRGIRIVLGVLIFILKEGLKYRFGKLKLKFQKP